MDTIKDFLSLSDPNVRNVVLGTILLSTSSSMIGTFALLKRKTLISDAISHAVLPGTCLAFFLTGDKHSTWLILGAFITGWLASIAIGKITTHSKIKQDTAIAIIASVSFGIGSFLLSILQHSGQANQGGLKSFLLGSAATLLRADIFLLLLLSLSIIIITLLFFKEFTIIAFDSLFAKSIGIPVKKMDFLFTSLMVLAIIIGIRAVGVVLMSAMLITPATTARFWTKRITHIMLSAMFISLFSSLLGTFISYTVPYMPTGPWIVLIMSFIAYLSFAISWCYGFYKKRK
ncbi:metal ABC transporter permease [Cardinium endosymbiont of Culicoides punctatus]|uniref:metal ABC transporter permease n=1 Tax=Cardinium endosymbiont of Culicoides punctatus TaxID=2304601 RepID=UPI0010587CE0|nr:iron chelate uptake ABC transporter family permease subunit [Cardinium endosymbiont of Culicoides punctatus]TDG95385.1 Manganese transport system membrane protein MntB [Cardinium endosymbiont of Culicoides punctatus]